MCPRLCTSLGMTENTGCVALGDEHTAHLGEVGTPGPGVHIKLENWEEGGYRVSNTGWQQGATFRCTTDERIQLSSYLIY